MIVKNQHSLFASLSIWKGIIFPWIFILIFFIVPIFPLSAFAQDEVLKIIKDEVIKGDLENATKLVLENSSIIDPDKLYKLITEEAQNKNDDEKILLVNQRKIKFIEQMIDQGIIHPNSQDIEGLTPAMFALYVRLPEFASKLIKHPQFNPNIHDDGNLTLSHLSAFLGIKKITQELIKHPLFDPNRQSLKGNTVGMVLAKKGDAETLEAFIQHPHFNPNLKSELGLSLIMYAVHFNLVKVIKSLIHHPQLDPNIQDHQGSTALMIGSQISEDSLMAELANHPSLNPNTQDQYGWTALMIAAKNAKKQTALSLLRHPRLQLNLLNQLGLSAAHYLAIYTKDPTLIFNLLKHPYYDANHLTMGVHDNHHQGSSTLMILAKRFHHDEKLLDDLISLHMKQGYYLTSKNSQNKSLLDLLKEWDKINSIKKFDMMMRGDQSLSDCYTDHQMEIDKHRSVPSAETEEQLLCQLCWDKITGTVYKAMGGEGCSCQICHDCHQDYLNFLYQNRLTEELYCPGPCHQPLQRSYFIMAGNHSHPSHPSQLSPHNLYKISLSAHIKKLSKNPYFVFCPTENCLGGRVLSDEDREMYQCPFCHQENLLLSHFYQKELEDQQQNVHHQLSLNQLLEQGRKCPPLVRPTDSGHPDYYLGLYRPCYYCGKITERIDGCNAMKCSWCQKAWHWNYGDHRHHPHFEEQNNSNGEVHDFQFDEMKYEPLKKAHF